MHNLIRCILRMDDYTEIMHIVLNYFAIDFKDMEIRAQATEDLEEAIKALEECACSNTEKSDIISYYLHELENSKKKVKECINTVQ